MVRAAQAQVLCEAVFVLMECDVDTSFTDEHRFENREQKTRQRLGVRRFGSWIEGTKKETWIDRILKN